MTKELAEDFVIGQVSMGTGSLVQNVMGNASLGTLAGVTAGITAGKSSGKALNSADNAASGVQRGLTKPQTFTSSQVQKVSGVNEDSGYSKDIMQYEKLKSQYAADEIYSSERVGSVLKEDSIHRAASYLSKEQLASGRTYSFTGGDNQSYSILQTQGQLNEVDGIFEYIIDSTGQITHQRFITGGIYTGFPNQIIPKGGY